VHLHLQNALLTSSNCIPGASASPVRHRSNYFLSRAISLVSLSISPVSLAGAGGPRGGTRGRAPRGCSAKTARCCGGRRKDAYTREARRRKDAYTREARRWKDAYTREATVSDDADPLLERLLRCETVAFSFLCSYGKFAGGDGENCWRQSNPHLSIYY
jgi:hypothetical protein